MELPLLSLLGGALTAMHPWQAIGLPESVNATPLSEALLLYGIGLLVAGLLYLDRWDEPDHYQPHGATRPRLSRRGGLIIAGALACFAANELGWLPGTDAQPLEHIFPRLYFANLLAGVLVGLLHPQFPPQSRALTLVFALVGMGSVFGISAAAVFLFPMLTGVIVGMLLAWIASGLRWSLRVLINSRTFLVHFRIR